MARFLCERCGRILTTQRIVHLTDGKVCRGVGTPIKEG